MWRNRLNMKRVDLVPVLRIREQTITGRQICSMTKGASITGMGGGILISFDSKILVLCNKHKRVIYK